MTTLQEILAKQQGIRKKRRHEEDALHIQIVSCLKRDFDPSQLLFIHCPNGGRRNKREAAKLKAMGVKAGTPDLLFWWKGKRSVTDLDPETAFRMPSEAAAIEIKTAKGRLTPEQEEWRDDFIRKGGKWALCRSYQEVFGTLTNWGVRPRYQ